MSNLLKDSYDTTYISLLSNSLQSSLNTHDIDNKFCIEAFISSVFSNGWQDKTLKERMSHIATIIKKFLPYNYTKCIIILKDAFNNINQRELYLQNMVFANFVSIYGIESKNYYISMDALECFTINSSSEFGVREFMLKYPNQTLKQMKKWTQSKNEHIRRLASEGSRIRLPWGVHLKDIENNPRAILEILEILERLKADNSKYVAKSVANSLNDISKQHPQMIIDIAKKWLKTNNKNTNWIIKHALRSLLKQGRKQALQMLGFKTRDDIAITKLCIKKNIKLNSDLNFSFQIYSKTSDPLGKIRVEYMMYFKRANNKTNKKVFFISQNNYKQNTITINRKYSFKPISTRAYHKGIHRVSIIINGKELASKEFMLI